MDIPEPVGPTIEKDCEEEHTSFQAKFMSDRWRHYMPHMRFRHIVLYRKVPLQMKLKLALERNIGPHAYIIVGDTVYKCQVLVCRIYCKRFKNLKKGDVVKFPDGAMSNEFFELAYAWMTSNEVYCPRDKLLDFLGAASFLHCIPLIKRVFEKLNDHRIHSELASFSCFLKARDMGITQMAGMMLSRVSKSFLVLVSNGLFLQLDIESACTLLSSSFLAVQNEIEIFYSALLWLISNYQKRKKHIPRVFGLVRFHMMPSAFLLKWTKILKDLRPELADFLCHHLHNAMLRQQEYYMDIFRSQYLGSDNRRWILDPKCPYADSLNANQCIHISPKVFISYLQRIQNAPDGFIDRLILLGSMEHAENVFSEEDGDGDEVTINEPSTTKTYTDDLEEQSHLDSEIFTNAEYDDFYPEDLESTKSDDSYYSGTKTSKSRTRSIAGEDNFATEGTDSLEDFDFVKGETKSEYNPFLAREKIFYRLSAGGIANFNIESDSYSDGNDDRSQNSSTTSSTTSSTDSLTDCEKESVHSTVADSTADSPADSTADSPADSPADSTADSPEDSSANLSADSPADSPGILLEDSPADSSASFFADSSTYFAGDSEDSNADSHPDSTAESATGYTTNSAGYSGTGSSVYFRTDSISSEVYERDYSFEYF